VWLEQNLRDGYAHIQVRILASTMRTRLTCNFFLVELVVETRRATSMAALKIVKFMWSFFCW